MLSGLSIDMVVTVAGLVLALTLAAGAISTTAGLLGALEAEARARREAAEAEQAPASSPAADAA